MNEQTMQERVAFVDLNGVLVERNERKGGMREDVKEALGSFVCPHFYNVIFVTNLARWQAEIIMRKSGLGFGVIACDDVDAHARVMKHHKAFWETCIRKGWAREGDVLIDDKATNIKAAERVGLVPVHTQARAGCAALDEATKKLGLLHPFRQSPKACVALTFQGSKQEQALRIKWLLWERHQILALVCQGKGQIQSSANKLFPRAKPFVVAVQGPHCRGGGPARAAAEAGVCTLLVLDCLFTEEARKAAARAGVHDKSAFAPQSLTEAADSAGRFFLACLSRCDGDL